MKILVPSEVLPHNSHSIRAANVVMFNLLDALMDKPDVTVHFLPVSTQGKSVEIDAQAREGLATLEQKGMVVEDPLIVHVVKDTSFLAKLRSVFWPSAELLFPILKHKEQAKHVVKSLQPDWVMTIWSEILTDLFAAAGAKTYAYYGNPIPKNAVAQVALVGRTGLSLKSRMIAKLSNWHIERLHLANIRNVTQMGNVAKNDAEYYARHNVGNSRYIQNTWTARFSREDIIDSLQSYKGEKPVKIAASVGKLGGTANSFGFWYMAEELLPALRRCFKGIPFELHIFGAGDYHYAIKDLMQEPEFVRRGFVDDIDTELMDCPVFLCCNNATEYNVGHTRYLHAWTLGRCVVSHVKVREAMPELEHEINCLLGNSAEEIADLIFNATFDRELCRKLSLKGFDTFNQKFDSAEISHKIYQSLEENV